MSTAEIRFDEYVRLSPTKYSTHTSDIFQRSLALDQFLVVKAKFY